MNTPKKTPRTESAVGIGVLMSAISDLNSYCFVESARRVLDETLRQLEDIRLEAMWYERERELYDEEAA